MSHGNNIFSKKQLISYWEKHMFSDFFQQQKGFFGSHRSGVWGPHRPHLCQDAYIRTSESLSAIVADYALDDDKLPGR